MANYNNKNKKNVGGHKATTKKRATYTNVTLPLGHADFYAQNLSDVMNILDKVPFDSISVPVSMSRALLNKDDSKGFVPVGNVQKVSGTNFTLSLNENASKRVNEILEEVKNDPDNECVVMLRCKKDYKTDTINYVSAIYIDKGAVADNCYSDIVENMGTEDPSTENDEEASSEE